MVRWMYLPISSFFDIYFLVFIFYSLHGLGGFIRFGCGGLVGTSSEWIRGKLMNHFWGERERGGRRG